MDSACADWMDCKRIREHVASLLPFKVIEAKSDRPLRIRGVAICSGMSRNRNIYTAEELEAFASKLADAPVYIEHVAVPNAIGKVTKTDWDGHNLWYEAEIYDEATAEKIRNGLIQHVSVGADYETVDVVDGRVPHGLHNAELSLVAVPGIPEANVQVLEHLHTGDASAEKLAAAEARLAEVEGKLAAAEGKLAEANKTIEQLKKLVPGVDLLADPPKQMPVAEAVQIVEGLLLSPAVERSSLGEQIHHQQIRNAIWKLKERL